MFNHKGGVAKTTSIFNIGWSLAEKGKRVLCADFDPQCNLTGLILRYDHKEDYPFESGKDEPAKNIRAGLAPAFDARPVPIQPMDVQEVPGREGLFVAPGHVALAENESTLSIAHELSASITALRNVPGSIKHLLDITASENGIDYILVDMSPSLGAINQNLLMCSDAFIVPMAPDFFSTMAISSLSRVLPRWKKWSERASEHEILLEAAYPWPPITPKLLGTIVQNYRRRSREGRPGAPTAAYQKWFDELSKAKNDILIPTLTRENMTLDESVYDDADSGLNNFLMEVPDFNSLIAKSQELSKPVFTLTRSEIEARGVVADTQEANIDTFREVYSAGADRIISLAAAMGKDAS